MDTLVSCYSDTRECSPALNHLEAIPIGVICYGSAIVLIKASILLLYKRIFTTKVMRTLVLAGLIFDAAFCIAFITVSCQTSSRHPTVLLTTSQIGILFMFWSGLGVVNLWIALLVLGSVDVLTDLLIFSLPIPFIIKLQMKRSRKIQVIVTFSIGALSVEPISAPE